MPKSEVVLDDSNECGSRIVSFYCPTELLEPLRRMAFIGSISRSKIIVQALEEYIDYQSKIYPEILEKQDGNC